MKFPPKKISVALSLLLAAIFVATFLIAYLVISLTPYAYYTQRAYSTPSGQGFSDPSDFGGEALVGNFASVFLSPLPGATNVSLDTTIVVFQMRATSVDLRLTPETPIARITEEWEPPDSRTTTIHPADLLRPATTYNVSGMIMGKTAWWTFTTTADPFYPRTEIILSPYALWIAVTVAVVATSTLAMAIRYGKISFEPRVQRLFEAASKQKRRLLVIVSALFLVFLLAGASYWFLLSQQAAPSAPETSASPFWIYVDPESNEGLSPSQIEDVHGNSKQLLVLRPGGTGTFPVLVSSRANESINASLEVFLGSTEAKLYGVHFIFSPANFVLKPAEQAKITLNMTADKEVPMVFCEPMVRGATDKKIEPGGAYCPTVLVANYTPSCIFYMEPPFVDTSPTTPSFKLAAGGEIAVMFLVVGTWESLSLNVTAPVGLSCQFSSSPMDVMLTYGSGKAHLLFVRAGSSVTAGAYKMNSTIAAGPYVWEWSFNVVVS